MQIKNILNVVVVAHYFPPINSSGAKRFQYTSKYFSKFGADVTVITTKKTSEDGAFTEKVPDTINLFEFDFVGRLSNSVDNGEAFVPMYSDKPSFKRKLKDLVFRLFGQIPDPRLPFAFSFLLRKLPTALRTKMLEADVIIATSPPWSMLLAGLFLKYRYKKKLVLDYRDNFSYCHEMPGGRLAKKFEFLIDRWLVKRADALVTISDPMKKYYSQFGKETYVVSNGYDYDAMELARLNVNKTGHGATVIRYMGIISEGRVPVNFIKALARIQQLEPAKFARIKVEIYGNGAVLKKYLKNNYPTLSSTSCFSFFDFVPYSDSLKLILESDYLLFSETSDLSNLSTQGILTTKLFEYLGSGRPVLADISDKTLAGKLIGSCGFRNLVSISSDDFFDVMSKESFFDRKCEEVSEEILFYTRKNQAALYYDILQGV